MRHVKKKRKKKEYVTNIYLENIEKIV